MPSTTPPPRWTSWSSENRGLTADLTAGRRLVSRPRLRGWAAPWLLLTPALILLCVLVLLPYAGALLFSVTDGRLITIGTLPRVVGLSNFEKVVRSTGPEFGLVVAASAVFTLGTLVGSLGLGTLLGLAVASLRPKLRGPLLALLLVPWIIAGVVVGYTWKLVYDPQIGLANAMLVPLGVGRVAWLLERWPAIAALVVANVWAAYGVVLLVVSSALTNVPQSLILAGQVDGAGTLTIIRRIVLPNMRRAFRGARRRTRLHARPRPEGRVARSSSGGRRDLPGIAPAAQPDAREPAYDPVHRSGHRSTSLPERGVLRHLLRCDHRDHLAHGRLRARALRPRVRAGAAALVPRLELPARRRAAHPAVPAVRSARPLRHPGRRHPRLRRRDHAARDLAHGGGQLSAHRTSPARRAYRWRRVRDDGTPDLAAAGDAGGTRGRDARLCRRLELVLAAAHPDAARGRSVLHRGPAEVRAGGRRHQLEPPRRGQPARPDPGADLVRAPAAAPHHVVRLQRRGAGLAVRVAIDGLTVRFGPVTAVDGLALEIRDRELLALVGPSGCGKTTTLGFVAGFVKTAAGRLSFDDRDVTAVPPERRRIGYVFQDYAIYPHMTVAENIRFPLEVARMARGDMRRAVADVAGLVGVSDLMPRRPHQLSGGQRQRVALAERVADVRRFARSVVIGVRPEDVRLDPRGVPGTVALVETLGRDILLHADVAGSSVRALVTPAEASRLRTGAAVAVSVHPQRWHFFDAA